MKVTTLGLIWVVALGASSQERINRERAEALDCAFNRRGPWIDESLMPQGKVSVTYLLEPANTDSPRTLYVAFWNATQTAGRLLVFQFSQITSHKDAVTISNEGWIWDNKGQPDIRDLQGGLYVYRHVKERLLALKGQRASLLKVDQLGRTSASCSSPLDYSGNRDRR